MRVMFNDVELLYSQDSQIWIPEPIRQHKTCSEVCTKHNYIRRFIPLFHQIKYTITFIL